VNTVTGDFMFEVAEGTGSKAGSAGAVRGATITGNGPEVLSMIDRVGSDLGFASARAARTPGRPRRGRPATLSIGPPFITVG